MIREKAAKIGRAARARWRLNGAPFFWHVGYPNFGDDINPDFFARLGGRPVRLVRRERPHFLGIGSILEKANDNSIVLGSGFLTRPDEVSPPPRAVVAVRGERSRDRLSGAADALLGDPMVLADRIFARPPLARRTAYLPHCRNFVRAKALYGDAIAVLDPRREPAAVVRDIASCETLISQSLHGLIIADAFGIPNLWIEPNDAMRGRFKFDDYFSTLDRSMTAHAETAALMRDPPRDAFSAGRYLHDKDLLAAALKRAISSEAGA